MWIIVPWYCSSHRLKSIHCHTNMERIPQDYTELYVRSQQPPMTNSRKHRHIVRFSDQNLPLPLIMQHRERLWCIERQNCHNIVFSDESRSACSILTAVYVSGGSEENSCHLLAFLIGIVAAADVMVRVANGYMTYTSLVRIDGILNAYQYISDILSGVVVPCLRGLPNAIFQQDNARANIARCVLTFIGTKGPSVQIWCPGLHFFQICHLLKTTSHGLLRDFTAIPIQLIRLMKCRMEWVSVSVVEAQFDSISIQLSAI